MILLLCIWLYFFHPQGMQRLASLICPGTAHWSDHVLIRFGHHGHWKIVGRLYLCLLIGSERSDSWTSFTVVSRDCSVPRCSWSMQGNVQTSFHTWWMLCSGCVTVNFLPLNLNKIKEVVCLFFRIILYYPVSDPIMCNKACHMSRYYNNIPPVRNWPSPQQKLGHLQKKKLKASIYPSECLNM